MKLESKINNVEGTVNSETNTFAIEASAKAFSILSDGLYSNKIKAVIRELSTNAYDAHVEAGCPTKPFDVQLPNNLNECFSVRDYGPGLSHEDCMQLFTTYFRSTKNNSNDAVGCLGLGSKSPFAYGDTFIVESFYGGARRIYHAYKGAGGFPEFDFVEELETDEPTGLFIKVPVKSGDFYRFEAEAENVYRFFNVHPNLNNKNLDLTVNKSIDGGKWYFDSNLSGNYVTMGQIAYPLLSQEFEAYPDVEAFLEKVSGVVIQLDIGDVDITPSRESLSYNKQTVKNLVGKIEALADSLQDIANDNIANCDSLYEARMQYISSSSIMNKFVTDVEYKGERLFDDFRSNSVKVNGDASKIEVYYRNTYRTGISRNAAPSYINFSVNGTKFVFIDEKVNSVAKIRNAINTKWYNVNVYAYSGTLQEFKELLGDAPDDVIIMVSELDMPPKKTYVGGSTGIPCKVYDENQGAFEDTKISVKFEDAYYIPEAKNKVEINGRTIPLNVVKDLLSTLSDAGFDFGGTFYTVKPSMVGSRKLNQRKNWSNGVDKIVEMYEELLDEHAEDIAVLKCYYGFPNFAHIVKSFEYSTNENMQELIDEYEEHQNKRGDILKKLSGLTSIFSHFGYGDVDIEAEEVKKEAFENRLRSELEKYPLLKHFDYSYYLGNAQEHIANIDKIAELEKRVEELEIKGLTVGV